MRSTETQSNTQTERGYAMSAQMEDGTELDSDRVDALIALIKRGELHISIEMIDDAIATGILDEA
jgi:anti-sigma28 factor (negative regulator of flagellin synthesis)